MSSYRRYNYRAYPTQGQCHELSRLYGACRYAYNWVIDQRELVRTRHGKMQTYVQPSGMFTWLKHDPGMEWLQDMPSTPLQQSIRHADTAYRNFFRLYNAALNILDAAGLAESLNAREGDVRRRLACTGLNANAATPQAGEPAEPQASIKATGVGIPSLQTGEEVNRIDYFS